VGLASPAAFVKHLIHMKITKASPFLGSRIANVSYIDIVNPENYQIFKNLFEEKHLLIFENLTLSKEELITIAKVFAEPVLSIVPKNRLKDYPFITKHTNLTDNKNKPLGIVAPEKIFHSDSYFTEQPTYATFLYSVIAPVEGGKTLFTNTEAAYNRLSDCRKKQINNLHVTYKNAYLNRNPVSHPVVWLNKNKKRSLYINRNRALGIEGLPSDEAMVLINELYSEASSSSFVYSHQWEKGDLLMWNNFTTQHAATSINKPNVRKLYRILTIKKKGNPV